MYRHFARVYDAFMHDMPYQQWAEYIDLQLKNNGVPRSALVLDLACGTGTMTALMAQKGYEMIGVDASADMLSAAYEKLADQKVLLLNQNILELDLYGTVDAAYSTCDALNYLLTEDELTQAFVKVALFLNPGGVFIFDLKTDRKYRALGDQTYNDSQADAAYIWKNHYDVATGINEYRVQFFQKDEASFGETHRQRAYSTETVEAAAHRAGLQIIAVHDNYNMLPAHQDSDRITYTCKFAQNA